MKVLIIGILGLWLYGVKIVVNDKKVVSTIVEMRISNKATKVGGGLMVKILSKSII